MSAGGDSPLSAGGDSPRGDTPPAGDSPRRRGRLVPAVLRAEPQFRLLFAGGALSVIGDRVTLVALPFGVLAAGGDVSDVGLVAAAQFIPFLLLALPAGVIADRGRRKWILVVSDALCGVLQGIAAILLLAGVAEVWHLAMIALAFGALQALGMPAISGFIPQTLADHRNIQPANALRSAAMSTGAIGGPTLAAALVALSGPGAALLFDAATFLLGASLVARIRPTTLPPADDEPGLLDGIRAGWREVRARSWVWSFLVAMAIYHVVVLPSVYVLGPVLSEEELGGAAAWGAIVASFGVGALLGDLLMLRWRPSRPMRVAAVALLVASSQAAVIGSGLPLGGILAIELLAAIGVSTFFTLWETSLQEHIPPRSLSRVSSYDYLTSVGLMPLGMAIAGPVSEAAGIHETLLAMSVAGWISAVALLGVRSVRELGRPAVSVGAP